MGEALWRTENASLLFLSLLVTYFIIANYLLGPGIPDPERENRQTNFSNKKRTLHTTTRLFH